MRAAALVYLTRRTSQRSAGTQATVVAFLKQAMQNVGYTLFNVTSSDFSASLGSNPTYRVDVLVTNPNNYFLRVFVPM